MTISLSIATRGHEVVCPEEGGVGPDRPCISLLEETATGLVFSVIPPPDIDYAGTIIQYTEVGACTGWTESGPEVGGGITVTGLTQGTIYAFVPYSYDAEGNLGKPGNPILASWPENVVDWPQLEINSCALRRIWDSINKRPHKHELVSAVRAIDEQLQFILQDKEGLKERLRRIEGQVAVLRRQLDGS